MPSLVARQTEVRYNWEWVRVQSHRKTSVLCLHPLVFFAKHKHNRDWKENKHENKHENDDKIQYLPIRNSSSYISVVWTTDNAAASTWKLVGYHPIVLNYSLCRSKYLKMRRILDTWIKFSALTWNYFCTFIGLHWEDENHSNWRLQAVLTPINFHPRDENLNRALRYAPGIDKFSWMKF